MFVVEQQISNKFIAICMNEKDFIIIDDDIVLECSLDMIRYLMKKRRTTCEREKRKIISHIAERLRACITSAKRLIFLFFFRFLPLIVFKICFAYSQRYTLEISTGTGIIDHADYEYTIFIDRKLYLLSPCKVI